MGFEDSLMRSSKKSEISEAVLPVVSEKSEKEVSKELKNEETKRDRELVDRFKGGDSSAFTEIFKRHRDKIFSVVLALLRNRADAEEITQDTFIRANRGLANFRGDSSLATWLHRIAVNLARNRYWYFFRRRRHDHVSLNAPLEPDSTASFEEVVPSDALSPDEQVTEIEFVERIAVAMEKLDPKHREILTLRNLLNKSYDEIAETLGIGVGTVKSRIARARDALRGLLPEDFPEFFEEQKKTREKELREARKEIKEKEKRSREKLLERLAAKYPQLKPETAEDTSASVS